MENTIAVSVQKEAWEIPNFFATRFTEPEKVSTMIHDTGGPFVLRWVISSSSCGIILVLKESVSSVAFNDLSNSKGNPSLTWTERISRPKLRAWEKGLSPLQALMRLALQASVITKVTITPLAASFFAKWNIGVKCPCSGSGIATTCRGLEDRPLPLLADSIKMLCDCLWERRGR